MGGKEKLIWHLKFFLNNEWLIKGASQNNHLDVSPLEDGFGRPYIPASTIKGSIKHEFIRLNSVLKMNEGIQSFIFGESGYHQGLVYFEDASLKDEITYTNTKQLRTRIAIDRKHKVVRDEAIVMEEVIVPQLHLFSEISCYVPEDKKEGVITYLTLSILNLSAIGSGKSIGRGNVRFTYVDKFSNKNQSEVFLEIQKGNQSQILSNEQFQEIVLNVTSNQERRS